MKNVSTVDLGRDVSVCRSWLHVYSPLAIYLTHHVRQPNIYIYLHNQKLKLQTILILYKFFHWYRWQKILKSRFVNALGSYASIYFNVILIVLILLLLGNFSNHFLENTDFILSRIPKDVSKKGAHPGLFALEQKCHIDDKLKPRKIPLPIIIQFFLTL